MLAIYISSKSLFKVYELCICHSAYRNDGKVKVLNQNTALENSYMFIVCYSAPFVI